MKVHVVEADMSGNFVQKRDDLGRAIGALAIKAAEPVYFHALKDPVGGAPVILLECSDTFLESVKKLPTCTNVQDVWPHIATERSAQLWAYFTTTPLKQSGPKP